MFLRSRDQAMRAETGDSSDITRQERFRKPLNDIVSVSSCRRPWVQYSCTRKTPIMSLTAVTEKLASEPILLLMSIYISLVCGLLCAVFFSFPVVIGDRYGWDHTNIGITFCSVPIWVAPALRITTRLEAINASKGSEVTREERLPGMLLGGPFVPLSLFIFGWTSPPYDPPQGAWGLGPFQHRPPFRIRDGPRLLLGQRVPHRGVLTYVASALAAKIVIRSALGAAMAMFITYMSDGDPVLRCTVMGRKNGRDPSEELTIHVIAVVGYKRWCG
ncbi:hypothetical protein EHS25_006988 [Saitozyma podzolica]|uniref:Uncharacterized protein n=1 Tax=Saitozyma podzolica TaxID=1890683 RepID=A0A427XPP9_9TREE|nr:hypothetical protein EHS25_006988 [Saitozyma podzolica]